MCGLRGWYFHFPGAYGLNTCGPAISVLETKRPLVSCRQAERLVRENFGIEAKATLLTGERDLNFRIESRDGISLLFKIANSSEEPAIAALQTRALLHLQHRCAELPVPRPLPALNGDYDVSIPWGGTRHVIRLMSYLPGRPIPREGVPLVLMGRVVESLAKLDLALCDFERPPSRPDLYWDTSRLSHAREHVPEIATEALRKAALQFLDLYDNEIAPRLKGLRAQAIHNDFNPSNILVSEGGMSVTGIIDFGDMVLAPLVCDLATALAYLLCSVDTPISALCELVSRYHHIYPLMVDEVDLLFDLILARLVLIVVLTAWHARLHPDNQAYILRNAAGASTCLLKLLPMSRAEIALTLRHACEL